MYKINIKVSSDRKVDLSSCSGGVTGEKNAASLFFEIPKEYSSYTKYLDVFKESGEKLQTILSIKDESEFSYTLPGELCHNLNVYMQLVMKKENEVFKSYRFVITFEEGINVTSYLEDNCRDSIQELFETKADKKEVSELSKTLHDKVAAQVFYHEKQILEDKISKKAEAFDVDSRLNLKADKTEVYEKLSLKADKTDVSAKLILKADKETVEAGLSKKLDITDAEAALKLKVDKEEGKGLSSNDYTSNEKEKLSGIAEGAEVNVQADWNELNEAEDSYIKNKPDLSLKENVSNKVNSLDGSYNSEHYPTVWAVKNYFGVKNIGVNPDFDYYTGAGIYTYVNREYGGDEAFPLIINESGLLIVSYRTFGDSPTVNQARIAFDDFKLKIYERYKEEYVDWSEWEDITPISADETANTYATKSELSAAIGEALEGDY